MQAEHAAFAIEDEELLEDYLQTMQNAAEVRKELQEKVHHYKQAVPFLQPGRIVKLKSHIPGEPVRDASAQPSFGLLRPIDSPICGGLICKASHHQYVGLYEKEQMSGHHW